jgi:DNA-binding CsgD family transcriptional regulator
MSVFLERDTELEVLRGAVEAATHSQGSVVVIAGEAGIGKTSLVRAWRETVPAGTRFSVGLCDDFLTSRTLGPFHDIAREAAGAVGEAVERADVSALLAAVLAALDHPLHATVVVLEDVHWADEATLDVVRYVGRRIAGRRGVLAITYRDDEVGPDHPLAGVLGVLPSEAVHRVRPRPLSAAAVSLMTASTPLDPGAVLRLTAGNPFFVAELTKDPQGVPTSVATSVLSRLRSLPASVRGAVELLSVAPRPVSLGLLSDLVSDVAVLGEAERRGLVEVEAGHARFRHDLTRQAVLDSLPATTRQSHHDAMLSRLLDGDVDEEAVLHHAVAVGRGDVVVRHGSTAAARAYGAGSHREASRHQQHVLAHADLIDADTRAQLLEEHAWSQYHLHRVPLAVAAARAAVELRRGAGEPAAHARALCTLSRMEYLDNQPAAASAAAEEAVATAEATADAEVLAEARLARASLSSLLDRQAEARDEARQVLAVAVELGRSDLEAIALNCLGTCAPALGEPPEVSTRHFIDAVTVARRSGHLEAAARAYSNLVSDLVWYSQPDLQRWYDEAIAFTSDHDFPSFRFNIVALRCRHLIAQGRWAEAEATLRELLDGVREPGVLELVARQTLARLLVRRGSPDAATELDRAWQVARRSEAAQYLGQVAVIGVERAYLDGDPAEAERIRAEVTLDELDPFTRGELLCYLARAGAPVTAASGPIAAPWVELLTGDVLAAVEGWADVGNSYERALALLATDDEACLLEALETLDQLGAEPAARLVRNRLRELGVRAIPRGPAPSTRTDPLGLTVRQREVLDLLADGLTNAQIADRLVVSVRTVDHHVSAVLQKVGATTRQEAAVRAASTTPSRPRSSRS